MPKRFTATEKWNKEWFQKLTPVEKCFWLYLCDACDQGGVWEPNFSMASFLVGAEVNAKMLEKFGDRVERLESGKYWIASFVYFQNGELSESCRAHLPVMRALQKHGLLDRVSNGYRADSHTLEVREEGMEEGSPLFPEEGTGGKPKRKPTVDDLVSVWNSTTLPKVQNLSPDRLTAAKARLRDPFFVANFEPAIKRIGASAFCLGSGPNSWLATFDWLLRPGTVAKVMEGKYDNRNANSQAHKPNPRNVGIGGDADARRAARLAAISRNQAGAVAGEMDRNESHASPGSNGHG